MLLMNFFLDLLRTLLSSTLPTFILTFILPLHTGFTGFKLGTSSPRSTKPQPSSSGTTDTCHPNTDTSASSTSDERLLRRVFQMVDADEDGYVSVNDVEEHLARLGLVEAQDREELTRLVQSACGRLRGGNRLDYEDFKYLYEVVCQGRDEEGGLPEAFAVFDVDADGFISVLELRQVLLGMGFTACLDETFCHRILTSIDSNLDGKIDFEEFRSFFITH